MICEPHGCCTAPPPECSECGCGRPVHGCLVWVDDREHPEWVNEPDEGGGERTAMCGPCREAGPS